MPLPLEQVLVGDHDANSGEDLVWVLRLEHSETMHYHLEIGRVTAIPCVDSEAVHFLPAIPCVEMKS